MDILREILAPYSLATMGSVVLSLLLAFALGLVISVVYRWTHSELASRAFTDTLVLLCMLISVVMVVIGDSVARAFSLVGALSIIRFRTVVQDPRDIAFVFFSLAVGMGVGAGDPPVAVISTFLISAIILVLHYLNTVAPDREGFLLTFRAPIYPEHEQEYQSIFDRYLTTYRLIDQKTAKSGTMELRFHVKMRQADQWRQFFEDISALQGVKAPVLKKQ